MRLRLRGINTVSKVLATGRRATYYYAWKGGPPLRGEPGSPEFITSYNEAVARKVTPPVGLLFAILQGFQASTAFTDLAPRTRKDYTNRIKLIEREFGDFPLAILSDRRTRGIFMAWRDKLAVRSRRQADYAWVVLARILAWASDRGLVSANPCARGGRLYRGSRADKIWTDVDEQAFQLSAPPHMQLPLQIALWTGQRQGDLLSLTWSAYNGTNIRLRQSKTGARVTIPVGQPLKVALDAAAKRRSGPFAKILVNSDGEPWSPDGFRSSWRKACAKAGIVGVTFHDLRGTAVTRLALVGCTEAEIATLTGHSMRDVRAILDANYLHRDPALAESAIRKLERRTKTPN